MARTCRNMRTYGAHDAGATSRISVGASPGAVERGNRSSVAGQKRAVYGKDTRKISRHLMRVRYEVCCVATGHY